MTIHKEPELENFLESLSTLHDQLCPRQVLGVRTGIYAAQLLRLPLPQTNKRVFAFVETDGCFVDGISIATGCTPGHRTLRLVDYGKIAATFVDTQTEYAVRIWPSALSRLRAADYVPDAPSRWYVMLKAYQIMPLSKLFEVQEVSLDVSLTEIISRPGMRVTCARCGEEISNEREVVIDGETLCRPCARGGYYHDTTSLNRAGSTERS